MRFRQLARSIAIVSLLNGGSAALMGKQAIAALPSDTSPLLAVPTVAPLSLDSLLERLPTPSLSALALLDSGPSAAAPTSSSAVDPRPKAISLPQAEISASPIFDSQALSANLSGSLSGSLSGDENIGKRIDDGDIHAELIPQNGDRQDSEAIEMSALEVIPGVAHLEPQIREISQNSPVSERSKSEDTLDPPVESSPVLPAEDVPASPASTPSSGDKVPISDIQVVGSSVFSAADFAPILQEYEGQSLGLRELSQAADDITQLYLESGYITSRAVLGEQTIENGVVQVRVIEGELEDIQIEGTRRLSNYVRDRVNLANRKPLNQINLESQLQLLRADPLIEQVEASLRAGTGEGQSKLIVRVLEAPTFSGRVSLDTNSPPSVGVARMGIAGSLNNPLGVGDRLNLSAFRTTAGGSSSFDATYTVPLNAMNGTLQARYLPSSFDLISQELQTLGIEGSSETYELTYRQPLIRQPNEEFALSLGFRHRTGETLVSNVVIDSTRTSVFQFGQDYLKRDQKGAWGLRSQFNLGTGLLDATSREAGEADGQFFSWLGQIQRAQVINRDNLLLMQASLQLSPDSLLGADQFTIGGPTSVRGYSQNARFGDSGFRASIENRITVLLNEDGSPAVQIAPFLDTAAVWNQGAETSDQRFLLGTGAGVITNLVEDVQARLDVGIPLITLDEPGDTDQSAFIYFSIDYSF